MRPCKQFWAVVIIIVLCLPAIGAAAAMPAGEVTVIILGEPLAEGQVIVINNHLLIPLRAAAQMAGWAVEWDEAEQCAAVRQEDREVLLYLRSGKVMLGGNAYLLSPPPCLADGKIYIPLRAVGEMLGEFVHWDEPARTAIIGPLISDTGPTDDTLFGLLRELYADLPEIFRQRTPEEIHKKLAFYYTGDLLTATAASVWDYVREGPTDYDAFSFLAGRVVQKNPLTATVEVTYAYVTLGVPPAEGRLLAGLARTGNGWRIIWEKYH